MPRPPMLRLGLLVLGLTLQAPRLQASEERPRLHPGESVERGIRGGESQVYEIELSEGDYVQIRADQSQTDLRLSVSGPDGELQTEVDRDGKGEKPETAYFVVKRPGRHCVEVTSQEKRTLPVGYRLTVDAVRPASPFDRLREFARDNPEEAEVLWPRNAALARLAVANYEAATSIWHELDEAKYEGRAREALGEIHAFLGDRKSAFEQLHSARRLNRLSGDRTGETITLEEMGVLHQKEGDLGQTLADYTEALEVLRSFDSPIDQTTLSCNLGWLYLRLGEEEKAETSFSEALHLAEGMSDPTELGVPLMGLGATCRSRGEYGQALDYLEQSLSIWRSSEDRTSEAHTLGQVAATYRGMGDPWRALEAQEQELLLCRDLEYRSLECGALRGIGTDLEALGDRRRSLEYYEEAAACSHGTSSREVEANALTSLGSSLREVGQHDRAAQYLAEALEWRVALGDRQGEIETRIELAKLERDRADLTCSREQIELAISLEEELRNLAASHEVRTSLATKTRQMYELYVDLLIQLHARHPSAGFDALALEASERSRAQVLLELLAESRADVRQGVEPELLEKEQSLALLLSGKLERQMRLLGRRHDDQEAAELAKEIQKLKAESDRIDAAIRRSSPSYAALTRPQSLNLAALRQDALDGDTVLLEYALGDKRSFVWAVTQESLETFELPKREEVEALARRVHGALASRPGAGTRRSARAVGRGASPSEGSDRRDLSALSRILLGPVAGLLGEHRLLIVVEGALQYVPFAALPIPADTGRSVPLMARHELVSAPSASVVALLRRESASREAPSKLVAVLADPVFEKDDPRVGRPRLGPLGESGPVEEAVNRSAYRSAAAAGLAERGTVRIPRLPYSRREAQQILSLAPPGERMEALDFEASRATALSPELGQYRFVHFATHGFLNSDRPELSGIVLSLVDKEGRETPGFLSMADSYSMRLPVDLVVLSACQTALGKEIKGEGLIGLTRGLMYAGARGVVASLWKVGDAATAEFMQRFYAGILTRRLTPAAALRQAQLEMWRSKTWSDPAHWAAFVLEGDWRQAGDLDGGASRN